jgi:multisubunit Na+/H+ antiporter MnhG subunit
MELLLFFAFAALFALGFNFLGPRAQKQFPSVASTFWGATLITTLAVMVLLVAVSFVFAEVGVKEAA